MLAIREEQARTAWSTDVSRPAIRLTDTIFTLNSLHDECVKQCRSYSSRRSETELGMENMNSEEPRLHMDVVLVSSS